MSIKTELGLRPIAKLSSLALGIVAIGFVVTGTMKGDFIQVLLAFILATLTHIHRELIDLNAKGDR